MKSKTGKKLVIVESPTKARTISRFLGRGFIIESSFGHIRDLPASKLGIDVENNFEPKYVIPKKARPQVKKLKDLAKTASDIVLATDEDREGEAIAWHLVQALGLNEVKSTKSKVKNAAKGIERIVFHEITKNAIEEALQHPRTIDMHLVDAQQARRVLDRLVGYKLSPFLWKKVAKGLSAGRVQSVAVRLIVEREREIKNFKPDEYWTVTAHFDPPASGQPPFEARLYKQNGEIVPKLGIKTKESSEEIVKQLESAAYTVAAVEKKAVERHPYPPFTTSTLQQEASRRFGYAAGQTMRLAQQLYEGIDIGTSGPVGLITYMRTDSLNLSREATDKAKEVLISKLGDSYALPAPRVFKTKSKGAQEAHEAIRPTDPARTPDDVKAHLDGRQFKIYQLIWQRFLASQMPSAIFDSTSADISAGSKFIFRANGSVLKFDGFLKVYPTKTEDAVLPELTQGAELKLDKLVPEQHFTEPPARYSEASLIKTLEKYGIGRPSTYAPTLATIQARGYVAKNEQKRFEPSEMGTIVNDVLVENFKEIVDIQFTAKMEEDLDKVADGDADWVSTIRDFYDPFSKNLESKYESVVKKDLTEETNEICEKCGKPLVIKHGRFGKFMACSGFPDCRNTKRLPSAALGITCPQCKEGEIIKRPTKRGKIFYGCSKYPECTFALWDKPTGQICPQCNSMIVEKGKKISCSNKECGYTEVLEARL